MAPEELTGRDRKVHRSRDSGLGKYGLWGGGRKPGGGVAEASLGGLAVKEEQGLEIKEN